MTSTTTAIILRDTNHILAAYTQKSGTKEPLSSKQFDERFFRNGLQLRFVDGRLSKKVSTSSELKEDSLTLDVTSSEEIGISAGDRLLIKKDSVESIVRITKVTSTNTMSPFAATVDLIIERAPSEPIGAAADVDSIGGSPSNEPFQIASRYLASVVLPQDALDIQSRPTSFAIKDGNPLPIEVNFSVIKQIDFSVHLTGVQIKVTTKDPNMMDIEIPVVCVLRTNKGENVVSTAIIPKAQPNTKETQATIPFAAIPSGDNLFLFMIKGFPPVWDRLPVNGKRTWKPTSA